MKNNEEDKRKDNMKEYIGLKFEVHKCNKI